MAEKVEEKVEKSLTFEEFFCPEYTVQQNALILCAVLKREERNYYLSKIEAKKIKTKDELEEKYNRAVILGKNLVINKEKIEEAVEKLSLANLRKKSVKKFGSPIKANLFLFIFYL